MGSLIYAARPKLPIRLDDRTLAHLQIVIGAKFRVQQSFFFSWVDSVEGGGGRSSAWLDPSIQLMFNYSSARPQQINREWLRVLIASANSSTGLQLTPEPGG